MATLTVKFEWDDEHGLYWFNIDNLKACLFSERHTHPDLLSVHPHGEHVEIAQAIDTVEQGASLIGVSIGRIG